MCLSSTQVKAEGAVEGGASGAEVVGDCWDGFAALETVECDGEAVVVDGGWSAAFASLGCCGAQSVEGAFLDEFAFHFGGHGGDYEQHLVGDRLSVRAVDPGADAGEDLKVDVT